jgi:hypothetical protein
MATLARRLSLDPLVDEVLTFAEGFFHAHPGDTLVVGFRAGLSVVAFAAGLPTDGHKAHLRMLARYLFARRGVDAYLVVTQASLHRCDLVTVECAQTGGRRLYAAPLCHTAVNEVGSLGSPQPLAGQEPLLGDLLAPGQPLPGVIRRELDRAYDILRVDYPIGA